MGREPFVLIKARFIIRTIMRNSCTTHRIRFNQGQFILKPPGNVQSLESVVKRYHGR